MNYFVELFQSYLDKFCKCPNTEMMSTSSQIMSNELDPMNGSSTIRRKSHFLQHIDRNYNSSISRPFFQRISEAINSRVERVSVSNADIAHLKRSFGSSCRLSDEDLSLITSSMKKSSEIGETCVITGDTELENKLRDIPEMSLTTLPSGRVRTDRLIPLNIYFYISCLHKCCELSNEEHSVLWKYLVAEDLERSSRMNIRVTRIKRAQFEKMFDLREEIRRMKESQTN